MRRHLQTKKHLQFMEALELPVVPVRIVRRSARIQVNSAERIARDVKRENDRVAKRGLPAHIVALMLTHSQEKTCTICYEDVTISTAFVTRCGHLLCKGCEKKLYNKHMNCPTCRSEF